MFHRNISNVQTRKLGIIVRLSEAEASPTTQNACRTLPREHANDYNDVAALIIPVPRWQCRKFRATACFEYATNANVAVRGLTTTTTDNAISIDVNTTEVRNCPTGS